MNGEHHARGYQDLGRTGKGLVRRYVASGMPSDASAIRRKFPLSDGELFLNIV